MRKSKSNDPSKIVKAVGDIISPHMGEDADNLTWADMRQAKKKERETDCKVGIMDAANVCMIYPNNENTYNLLKSLYRNNKDGWARVPEVEYKTNMVSKSKYSTYYLEAFLKIGKALDVDSAVFVMGKDTPINIEFENDDYAFGFILAPRVDT